MFRSMKSLAIAALAHAAMIAAAAPAAPPATPGSKGDPNEVICERQKVLGSRLAARRVCMTRAEWAEQRNSDRDLVQNSQLMVRQKNPCSLNGC
jgi:hypothetical protein